jgi:hypothetical protein
LNPVCRKATCLHSGDSVFKEHQFKREKSATSSWHAIVAAEVEFTMNQGLGLLLIFLCAPGFLGQTAGNSVQTTESPKTSVTGCLKGANGNYTITGRSGTTYLLTGDTASLQDHTGHKLTLTGKVDLKPAGTRASNETASNPSEPTSPKTFHVSSIKSVGASCAAR